MPGADLIDAKTVTAATHTTHHISTRPSLSTRRQLGNLRRCRPRLPSPALVAAARAGSVLAPPTPAARVAASTQARCHCWMKRNRTPDLRSAHVATSAERHTNHCAPARSSRSRHALRPTALGAPRFQLSLSAPLIVENECSQPRSVGRLGEPRMIRRRSREATRQALIEDTLRAVERPSARHSYDRDPLTFERFAEQCQGASFDPHALGSSFQDDGFWAVAVGRCREYS